MKVDLGAAEPAIKFDLGRLRASTRRIPSIPITAGIVSLGLFRNRISSFHDGYL